MNIEQDLRDVKRVRSELGIVTTHNIYNINNIISHLSYTITYSKKDSNSILFAC